MKRLVLLIIPLFLFAQENLDSLLDEYEDTSELYKKTKDESAGNLVVYSRKDIDIMQVRTIKDLLKSLHHSTIQEDQKGETKLHHASAATVTNNFVRLYLNDHELSSAVTGNALGLFGDYDLGHIDHVEVYLGGSGLKFGDEFGFVTIRLYTKEADREQGGFVNTLYGTNNSYRLQTFYAGVTENELEYLVYANKKDENQEKISNQGFEVPRYITTTNFYANVKKDEDYSVEVSLNVHETDLLSGVGSQRTPSLSKLKTNFSYISFVKYFDNLKIKALYGQEQLNYHNIDNNGIRLYNGNSVNELEIRFKSDIIKVNAEYSFDLDEYHILVGTGYQYKAIGSGEQAYFGTTGFHDYSAYAEYEYNFNPNNMFVVGAKWNRYDHIGYERSDSFFHGRLGYVSLFSEELTLKLFYTHNYFYPAVSEFITLDKPIQGNDELKPIEVKNYSAQIIYDSFPHKISLLYLQANVYDSIMINQPGINFNPNFPIIYFNSPISGTYNDYVAQYTYSFNNHNRISIEYYALSHNLPIDFSARSGGYIKAFNSFEKFDFYNELIYRQGYYSYDNNVFIKDGYDWTTAITYNYSEDFTVAFKGENILDKAIKMPVRGLRPVDILGRRFSISMNWYF